jgi:polysaccharide pyruvyl transferase CsaB
MRLLLAGYFSCGNLGDDAILAGFSEGVDKLPYDLTVLSGNPENTFRVYGMSAIPRKEVKAVQAAMNECDALVFPGGSIFQDVTSLRSTGYYAALVKQAKKAGKKVIFLGQGVGPLNSFMAKRMAVGAFSAADAIVVRDPGSAQLLRDIGVKRAPHVSADMAFLMREPPEDRDKSGFAVGDMKTIGIAPRPFGKETKNIIKLFGEMARLLYKSNLMPVLIEMDQAIDRDLITKIGNTQGGKVPDIRGMYSPMQIQERISRMETVISMRLHGGILAATCGVPPFMISYDPKVIAFAKLMDLPAPPNIEGLTADRLFDTFMSFLKDGERNRKIIAKKKVELRKQAELNIEVLQTCLKGKAAGK